MNIVGAFVKAGSLAPDSQATSVQIHEQTCAVATPVLFRITNNTDKEFSSMRVNFTFSDDLVDGSGRTTGRGASKISMKVLKPGKTLNISLENIQQSEYKSTDVKIERMIGISDLGVTGSDDYWLVSGSHWSNSMSIERIVDSKPYYGKMAHKLLAISN